MKKVLLIIVFFMFKYIANSQELTCDTAGSKRKMRIGLSTGSQIFTTITEDIPNDGWWSPRTGVVEKNYYNLWYETRYFLPVMEASFQCSEKFNQSIGATFTFQQFTIDGATVSGAIDSVDYKSYYIYYQNQYFFKKKVKKIFSTNRYVGTKFFFTRKEFIDNHEFSHYFTGSKTIYNENNFGGSFILMAGLRKCHNRLNLDIGLNYNFFTIGMGSYTQPPTIKGKYFSFFYPDYKNGNLGLFGNYGRISHSPISFNFKIGYRISKN